MIEVNELIIQRIESIEKHADTQNRETGELRDCIAQFKAENAEFHGKMSSDMDWLKKWFFLIATSSVGALVAGVLGLIFRR